MCRRAGGHIGRGFPTTRRNPDAEANLDADAASHPSAFCDEYLAEVRRALSEQWPGYESRFERDLAFDLLGIPEDRREWECLKRLEGTGDR